MYDYSSKEMFGADALNLAAIIGAGLILLAAITAPATYTPTVAQAQQSTIETVTVVAKKTVS